MTVHQLDKSHHHERSDHYLAVDNLSDAIHVEQGQRSPLATLDEDRVTIDLPSPMSITEARILAHGILDLTNSYQDSPTS